MYVLMYVCMYEGCICVYCVFVRICMLYVYVHIYVCVCGGGGGDRHMHHPTEMIVTEHWT